MEELEVLARVLQHEAKNIFEDSGEVVDVTDNAESVDLKYKNKIMNLTPCPRHNFVQWGMPSGRGGFVRIDSPASAAVDLLQTLFRSA
jgi:hypothetical protein